VRPAVRIKHRFPWISAKTERPALVARVLIGVRVGQPKSESSEHMADFTHQSLMSRYVVGLILKLNATVRTHDNTILRTGHVLSHCKPIDAAGHPRIVSPKRNGRVGIRGLGHHAVGPPLRLNLPQRMSLGSIEVEIVDRHRFLEHVV
ncbi:uncharacterized protein METZ01_LOCUS121534, partial [marine metagenome]